MLDWIGLDWIGLDWIGLDWTGLVRLDWIGEVQQTKPIPPPCCHRLPNSNVAGYIAVRDVLAGQPIHQNLEPKHPDQPQ